MSSLLKRFDLRVSLLYFFVASLWIVTSDTLIIQLFGGNRPLLDFINTFKGIGFVTFTAIGLYVMVSREFRMRSRLEQQLRQEVGQHQRAAAELEMVTRLYRLLTAGNQTMIRAVDETQLLHSICEILVEIGGYRLAWIGYGEHDEKKSVSVVASAGKDTSYLADLAITWDDSPSGQGPTGTAIRTGEIGISRFILSDPKFRPWRAQAIQRGYASSIALPLRVAGVVIGALNVYSGAENAFDAKETELLTEMASDIGFGIQALRTAAENRRIRIGLEQERDISPVGIVILKPSGGIQYANARAQDIFGLTLDTLTRQAYDAPLWKITDFAGNSIENETLPFAQVMLTGQPIYGAQHAIELNGERTLLEINAAPIHNPDGSVREVIATLTDVTQLYQYNARLEMLHAIDLDIISARSPEAISNAVLSRVRGLIGCELSVVGLIDEQANTTTLYGIDSEDDSTLPFKIARQHEQTTVLEALRQGRTIKVPDMLVTPTSNSSFAQQAIKDGIRAVIIAPMLFHNQLNGFFTLGSRRANYFTDTHAEIAGEVANQLAIAFQNAKLLQDIQSSNEQLQGMSARLVEAQEAERRHIARELHDEIGQTLTALSLMLNMHSRHSGNGIDNLAEAQALVSSLMKQVRELSLNLRPSMLDDLGLIPTLAWYLERYEQQTGIQISFRHNDMDRRFTPTIETTLYRITQEALTNVARHAKVNQASVSMWSTPEAVHAQIEDEGQGFEPDVIESQSKTGGILGLKERAQLAGGVCEIASHTGEGTVISVTIPIHRNDHQKEGP